MSEHKFKTGDKVIDKNFPDTILTVCTVDGDIVEAEPEKYNLPKWTYNAKNLEPISDHLTADEIAKLIASTPTERQDVAKLDEESDYIANIMEEVTGYGKGYKIGFKDGYDAHCKEIAQVGAMHPEYRRGWRECRAKMMEFISKDYQDDFK